MEKEKINKIIDTIGLVFICAFIIGLNLYIGSNIRGPVYILQIIAMAFTGVYIIVKKIVSKENVLIKTKLDICVFVLLVSTFIPLLFGTYATKSGTIDFILKYTTMFSMYVLVKNIIVTDKSRKILINSLILSSLIVIIFGIDKLYFHTCNEFLKSINAVNLDSNRLISTFGYANSVAIYMSLTIFLALGRLLDSKAKVIKISYGIYILIALATVVLTNSRSVILMLGIALVAFVLIQKKFRIKYKIVLPVVALAVIYVIIGLQFSRPVEVKSEAKEYELKNLKPDTEYVLKFDIDSNSASSTDSVGIQIIEISRYLSEEKMEEIRFSTYDGTKEIKIKTKSDTSTLKVIFDKEKEDTFTVNKLDLNNKEYILNYKFMPNMMARFFTTLNFNTSSAWQRGDFIADGFKIAGNHHTVLGNGGNAWKTLYKQEQSYNYDAVEAHSYPIEVIICFGILGTVAFIAIIVITVKNAIKIMKKLKMHDKSRFRDFLTIILGTALILVHSIFDFDLSFLILLVITYMLLGVIDNYDKDNSKIEYKFKVLDFVFIIILISGIVVNINDMRATKMVKNITKDMQPYEKYEYYDKSVNLSKNIYKNRINEIMYLRRNININDKQQSQANKLEIIKIAKEYVKDEPYFEQNFINENLLFAISESTNEENIQEQVNNIKFVYDNLDKYRLRELCNPNSVVSRQNIILGGARICSSLGKEYNNEEMKSYSRLFVQLVIREYSISKEKISNYRKTGMSKEETEKLLNEYQKNYESAITSIKNIKYKQN